MKKTSKQILFITIFLGGFLICQNAWAACVSSDNYDCVPCTQGETGSCRQPKDLTLANIQATIDASASSDGTVYGDGVYLKEGSSPNRTNGPDGYGLIINKAGLVLKGTGSLNTVLNINISSAETIVFLNINHVRITNIHFILNNSYGLHGGGLNTRVDHCQFTGGHIAVWADTNDGRNNVTGVIDNNIFDGNMIGPAVELYGPDVPNYVNFLVPVDWDFESGKWLFVEGNTFNLPSNGIEVVETTFGGKLVARYNTFNEVAGAAGDPTYTTGSTYFEMHNTTTPAGSGGGAGGRAYVVNNNKIIFRQPFSYTSNNGFIRMLYFRSGTALIHDNIIDYSARGAESLVYFQLRGYRAMGGANHDEDLTDANCANDGNDADFYAPALCPTCLARCCSNAYHAYYGVGNNYLQGEGYPCVGQPGQGVRGGTPEPVYFWDNKKTADGINFLDLTANNVLVASTEQWAIMYNRDYCISTTGRPASCGGITLNYNPYACPHPLTGLTGTCDPAVAGTAGYNVGGTDTTPPAAPTGVTVN